MTSWQDEHFLAGVRDFAAGTLSGVAGVIAGHPLDTIRVRMQLSKVGSTVSTKDVWQNMVSSEGVMKSLSLFKGMASPMAGVGLLSAMLFYGYGQIQMVQKRFGGGESLGDVFVAGTGAGLFQTTVLAPIDNVKIRLQVQTNQKLYRGPLHCLSALYRSFGIRGVYKGMVPTLWRDSWSYGIYFAVYEASKRKLQGQSPSPSDTFIAGGIAGVLSWLPVYPIDVIKSRIQEDNLTQPKYKGILDCFKKSIQLDGFRVLFRGLSPTLLRTFIVSGANFFIYEIVSESLP